MLDGIGDRRVREVIVRRIRQLEQEPKKQGSSLGSDLAGYRSIRAVGQRYRIAYQIDAGKVIVLVIAVGIRRDGDRRDIYSDIYSLAQRLVNLGLVQPPE